MSDSLWFHRGKEACARGEPRELRDARISQCNREEWFAGWDEQHRYSQAAPSLAEIEEARRVKARLVAWAKTL